MLVPGNELSPEQQAKALRMYGNRFTMEHVPPWARLRGIGGFYGPQFTSDQEWLAHTKFHVEAGQLLDMDCFTGDQTWPLGMWLSEPFTKPTFH